MRTFIQGPIFGPGRPLWLAFALLLACPFALAGIHLDPGVGNKGEDPPGENSLAVLIAGERWMEAECAREGEEWQPDSTDAASNRFFVYFPGNDKLPRPKRIGGPSQLTFSVDLSVTAAYTLYFRVNSPAQDRNSVWVSIDNGPWAKFWKQRDQEQLITDGFEWREVVDDGSPLNLNLSTGKHTIRVAARETGTQFDKIFLSPSGRHPDGIGAHAPTCPPRSASTLTGLRNPAHEPVMLAVYPNPTTGTLRVPLPAAAAVPSFIRVTGADGRQHALRQPVAVSNGGPGEEMLLDIHDLPAGVYTLRFGVGDQSPPMVATFVKTR
ncbi:hypothetical protein [Lewinella sp. IMCC34191]|uniref:hypothetical protein n=1 Tax=Lewinella sp. IMCC34191 TaxID=2259172 RepID=UPI001300A87E|nr:hypothetical protein [Lewinella sp. IMCC34191]